MVVNGYVIVAMVNWSTGGRRKEAQNNMNGRGRTRTHVTSFIWRGVDCVGSREGRGWGVDGCVCMCMRVYRCVRVYSCGVV